MKLCDSRICTGCGACINACPRNCISMERNEQGFDYPRVDEKVCVNCGLCSQACPRLHLVPKNAGPEVYAAAYTGDDNALKRSSSGGVAYALSKRWIEEGGVVFGAAYVEDMQVRHIGVSELKDLPKLQGSKYVQSQIGTAFREAKAALKVGRKVLFFGMPCQVAGLKAYLTGDDQTNLVTCDLFCGGHSSPGIFEKYLDYLKKKYNKPIVGYDFRSKKFGYGYGALCQVFFEKGNKALSGIDATYADAFHAGYIRNSCYECEYADATRVGDITVGDFWNAKFDYKTWNKGVSLVLVNSPKGRALMQEAASELRLERKNGEDLRKSQGFAISKARVRPADYEEFFSNWSRLDWDELSKRYLLSKSPVKRAFNCMPATFVCLARKMRWILKNTGR